jgi:hypothetical protein
MTLGSFVNAEIKEQTEQWMHTYSPNKLKQFEHTMSAMKLMAAVFWDRTGELAVDIMQQETTVSEV